MLILVVDDEESLCELIAEILGESYQVLKAYNGKEALEVARLHKPDLIISDVMMPHLSGVELLKILRENEATQNIPVILLSAATPQSAASEAEAFIRKPFEIDVLEKIVYDLAKTMNGGNSSEDSRETENKSQEKGIKDEGLDPNVVKPQISKGDNYSIYKFN